MRGTMGGFLPCSVAARDRRSCRIWISVDSCLSSCGVFSRTSSFFSLPSSSSLFTMVFEELLSPWRLDVHLGQSVHCLAVRTENVFREAKLPVKPNFPDSHTYHNGILLYVTLFAWYYSSYSRATTCYHDEGGSCQWRGVSVPALTSASSQNFPSRVPHFSSSRTRSGVSVGDAAGSSLTGGFLLLRGHIIWLEREKKPSRLEKKRLERDTARRRSTRAQLSHRHKCGTKFVSWGMFWNHGNISWYVKQP